MTTSNGFVREKFIKNGYKTYNIPVVYRHWQLRDMLKHFSGRLVFQKNEKLVACDMETDTALTVMDHLYCPATTFDINDSFVACGNSRGEVIVSDRVTKEKYDFFVGSSIVNAIKMNNQFLFICSNERTLTMYDLKERKVLSVYTHDSQINNCDVNLEGEYLIACGDTKDVLMFNIRNNSLEHVKTLSSMDDGGFGISWNAASSMFAVGTQDGYACIWDSRWDKKMKILKSHQHMQTGGAIRNLQFTKKNLVDVLIWTEHSSCFCLIDTRTFRKSQVISVNDSLQERFITGLALNNSNDQIFISTNENIMEFSFDFNIRRVSSYGEYS